MNISSIRSVIREEIQSLMEDDSWWQKMSADQQADYIKQHPQSQKAQDAKKEKEKEDNPFSNDPGVEDYEDYEKSKGGDKGGSIEVTGNTKAQEIEDWYDNNKDKITDEADREELSDMIRGLSTTEYDLEVANDEGDPYEEAEYLQNQIEDYKDDIKGLISKYDKKPSDDKPVKPKKDDIEDINNGSALDKFINKYDFSDEEEDELYQIQSDMDKGYTSAQGAQAKITRLLGLEKELSYTPPQVKQKVAGAADARQVRNNVMNRLGRDRFNKLSYGELQQAYADEFERLGFKKDGKDYVKQESVEETKKRDYKAEYKKFQSSTKAKKYRAELNKYNRQKGTYGNGDGKDASHKGGKIVGFESQSKNRGRAEKSRLKKESLQENLLSFYQYMGDFYGKKGLYPDKKGRDLKVGDINKALSVYLKKYAKDTFTGDSLDRERVRDILIKMKKIDPQYKKQEVKENRDKIKKYLMSKGDNEKDATDKLRYYDLVKKLYKGSPPAKQAQIMSSLWANEGIEEGKMRPAVKKLLKQKGYSPIFNAIDQSKRQFKQMRYSRGEIQDTLIDMFGDEDPKILQKIKESVNEKNYQMFPSKLVDMAVKIAKAMGGNMTGAVKKIEKMRKGLSQNGRVKYALRQANESYDIWMEDGSWGYTFKGLLPEAEYQGRKVKLGKPMQGDVKKFKVYVKNPKGNVVKVNFGQGGDAKGGTMKIRKSNPKARKSFRARHNCDNPGPRHKARYWSCRKW